MFEFGLVILLIVGLVVVAKALENRAKNKGSLFSGKATLGSRILAFILGVVFFGMGFLQSEATGWVTIIFPLLGVACLLYTVGAIDMVRGLQNKNKDK